MSDQSTQPKVLRIGIIQDKKLIEERIVNAGASVTIGADEGCTLVVPEAKLSLESFPLFVYQDGQYRLQFNKEVKGKITSESNPVSLDKARKDRSTPKEGDFWYVPLTEEDRGKLAMGGVTLLFQFVPEPPVAAATALEQMDFRPRLIEDDDPVFLGILAVWMALGTIFGVYVANADPPELSADEVREYIAQITIVRPTEPAELDESTDERDVKEVADADAKKVKAKEKVDDTKPRSKVEQVRDKEVAKDKLLKESKLFQQLRIAGIGTTGENSKGLLGVSDAMGDFGADIDAKLRAVEGGDQVAVGGIRTGTGVPGGTGDRTIGELEAGEDIGNTSLSAGPKVEVKPEVTTGDIDFDGGSSSGVAKVVRKYQGQLKYCYEKQLKVNPSLHGRVVIGWTVEEGSAVDIYIVENRTGDEEFAKCLKGKVKRWDFSGVDDGNAKQPFVFQPQG